MIPCPYWPRFIALKHLLVNSILFAYNNLRAEIMQFLNLEMEVMNGKTKEFIRIMMIIVGNLIDAIGFVLFVDASGLIMGGSSGIGLLIARPTGISTSTVVFCVNGVMLLLGLVVFGKKFALSTVLSSFCYPASMAIVEKFMAGRIVTDDIFLCTIMGGILIGLGAGMVLRAGASSGGMDVPALMLNKYLRIPLSTAVYIIDIAILIPQMFQTPGDKVLYGIVLILVYSTMIEKVSLIGRNRVEVQIISNKSDLIRDAIIRDLDRGVTMMKGRSGYLGKDIEVVMSIVSSRQLSRVERIVHKIDPTAFLVVNRVSAVVGEGFTYPAAPDPVVEETSAS